MDLKEIKAAIKDWSLKRGKSDTVISLFNQGNCIEVKRGDYNVWNANKPEYLHVYLGVFVGKLKFVLIDSVSDQNTTLNMNFIFVKDYNQGVPVSAGSLQNVLGETDEITTLEALERNFRWQMGKNSWVTNQVKNPNLVFQAFRVPFTDLDQLFADPTKMSIYGLIAMTKLAEADFIFWNETNDFSRPGLAADVALPVPPFGPDYQTDFQLLTQSV